MVPLKQYNTQSRISLEKLKQCSSNLATAMYIIEERKWHLSCSHGNSYAAGAVLIETKIPKFYLKQGSSTPTTYWQELRPYGNHVYSEQNPQSCFKRLQIANGGIWFFRERDWNQGCYHGNKMVGVILLLLWYTFLVPSLKTSASIFREIFLIQYFVIDVEASMTSSLSSFA